MSQTKSGNNNFRYIPEEFKKVYFSKINDADVYLIRLDELACKNIFI